MANAAIFNALMGRQVRSVDDYLTQYEDRDLRKSQIQQNALAAMENSQLRKLQMEEVRGRQTAALLKAQQDQQKEQQRASTLARLYAPITGTQANAASGMTGPTPQAAAMIGQRRKPKAEDLPALIQAGLSNEQIKLLYEGDTLGMPEVARVLDTIGADRMPVQRREDKFGRPIGDPLKKPVEMKLQDLGGQVQAINPYALDPGQTFTKTMTQTERDSSARGWAGLDIQRQAEARQAEAAKLAAAGGGKQGPMSVTLQKELLESDDVVQSSAAVIGTLTQAKAINDKAYSGYLAKPRATLRSNLPGASPSADATINLDNMMTGQALESLKATFGAAPTEGERKILMDMQASADKTPTQRKEIIDRAIAAAKRRGDYAARKAEAIRSGKYLSEGIPQMEAPSPALAGGAPAVGTVVDGYRFKGGDPSKQSSWEKQ